MTRSYRPRGAAGASPGVVVVPGSTGVEAMAPTAALLASHGYVAGVLAYMQEPDLPTSLREIPLEALQAGMRAFAARGDVDADRVGVLCVSVGTGVALGAVTRPGAPPVRAVVAVAPTNVVWQALGAGGPPPKASSVTWQGRQLPYVPMRGERLLGQMIGHAVGRRLSRRPRSAAMRLAGAYAAGLRDADAVRAAAIPVEELAAPLLLIAGEQDAMWPSVDMAQALARRRRDHGRHGQDRVLLLPGAGHFLRAPVTPTTVDRNDALVAGGTPAGSARGQRIAWDATLAFLGSALRDEPGD